MARLQQSGLRVVFLTNNSSGTVEDYVAKLRGVGVDADPADVGSSAQAAAVLLVESLAPGARVLACAGAGVVRGARIGAASRWSTAGRPTRSWSAGTASSTSNG